MNRPLYAGWVFATLLFSVAILAACGGGSGGGAPGANGLVPASTPTPCPAGYSGSAPACNAVQQSNGFTPLSSATTAPLPAIGGYSGTINVPPASLPGPVQITTSVSNPGVPPLWKMRASRVRIAASTVNNPLLYITFTATNGAVVFTGFPSFSISVPSNVSGPFYLAELENGTWTTIAGPANGNPVMLKPNLPTLTIGADASVYFVLYTGSVVPSAAPSASPGGQPTSSPTNAPAPSTSPSPNSSSTPGTTPTPLSTATTTPTPVATPSSTPTLAPTTSPTATHSPTPFPSITPSPTPTPGSGSAQIPKTLSIGSLPSTQAGQSMSFASGTFSLTVKNSSNLPISGTYANPVTISSSDASGVVQVSNGLQTGQSVQVTSDSQLVGIVYSGAAIAPVTITASASTVATNATATFTPATQPIVYNGPRLNGSPEIDLYATSGTGSSFTFTATQAGYTAPFSNAISISGQSSCSSFATISPSAGTSFTVSSIATPANGSCTITLNGFNGSTLGVTITYTTFGVTLH